MTEEYPTYRLLVSVWRKIKAKVERRIMLLRHEYWRQQLGSLGRGVKFHGRIIIERPQRVTIGDGCTFNEGIIIYARSPVTICNDVHIAVNVIIMTGAVHSHEKGLGYTHYSLPVMINEGVKIYSGAQINPGVTIGHHSVVAAGAVVTRDVLPNTLVAGVPARVVKHLVPEQLQES